MDNRPLKYEEFEFIQNQVIYVSATPSSRISIKHGGFGKAIYINHPNGYTTRVNATC